MFHMRKKIHLKFRFIRVLVWTWHPGSAGTSACCPHPHLCLSSLTRCVFSCQTVQTVITTSWVGKTCQVVVAGQRYFDSVETEKHAINVHSWISEFSDDCDDVSHLPEKCQQTVNNKTAKPPVLVVKFSLTLTFRSYTIWAIYGGTTGWAAVTNSEQCVNNPESN